MHYDNDDNNDTTTTTTTATTNNNNNFFTFYFFLSCVNREALTNQNNGIFIDLLSYPILFQWNEHKTNTYYVYRTLEIF